MSFDENELRRALEARSGEVTPEYRARLRRSVDDAPAAAASSSWMAAIAVVVVTLLTATSVAVLLAARNARHLGPLASGPRVTSPSPPPTESPIPNPMTVIVSAPTTNVIWVLVGFDQLYRSTDKGNHWERRTFPPNVGARSMSFISEREGWVLQPGSPATQCQADSPPGIWHTTDGGSTWSELQSIGFADAQCKTTITFVDSRHGFVGASDPNHQPTVYRTADGGRSWKGSTLPDPPDFASSGGGFTLAAGWIKQFGGTLYLMASGAQDDAVRDRQYIFVSIDGGASWRWKQKIASPYTVMVTESRWLQLAPGKPEETVNGGQQFHPFESDFSAVSSGATVQASFADADLGYAVAAGILRRTTDGGTHWTVVGTPWMDVLPSPSPTPISMPTDVQLSAPSTNVVWALVAGHSLFRSTDRGTTWARRAWVPYQGGGGNPVVSFVDAMRGWAIFPGVPGTQCLQASAQLWATSDGAATWKVIARVTDQTQDPKGLPFDQCKEYMAFIDASHGFVVGHDTTFQPIVSRTSDGGVSWSRSTLPDPSGFLSQGGNAFRVVEMKAFGGVVLVLAESSAGGQFAYRSTDQGATWSFVAAIAADPYVRISFVTPLRWLVIGNDGIGQETADGGKTWRAWSCDYRDAAGVASTFVFADATVGYGTVRGGIQRTTDGGLHWTRVKTPGT